jgi:hypothetical protein
VTISKRSSGRAVTAPLPCVPKTTSNDTDIATSTLPGWALFAFMEFHQQAVLPAFEARNCFDGVYL